MRLPVLVVDDHEMLAAALAAALRRQGFDAHWLAVTDVDTMAVQAGHYSPGVALLDLNLGLGTDGRQVDGAELVRPLALRSWRVLILTGHADLNRIAAALAAGATNWVPKSARFEELTRLVTDVARGGGTLSHQHRLRLRQHHGAGPDAREARQKLACLSPREQAVLDELGRGMGPADIARHTHTSVGTVRTHVRAILTKLEVSSQVAAVAVAHRARSAAPSISAGQWRRATRYSRRRR